MGRGEVMLPLRPRPTRQAPEAFASSELACLLGSGNGLEKVVRFPLGLQSPLNSLGPRSQTPPVAAW